MTTRRRRSLAIGPAVVLAAVAARAVAGDALPADARPPVEYVLQALDRHRIVVLGEAHWVRHDVELVAALAPALAARRVTLAMETLPADDQERIDRLLSAPAWDEGASLGILRRAAWPYREYQTVLRRAWEAGTATPGSMRVLALGPPPDWRARGIDYDRFMADRVAAAVEAGARVLLYCGQHHAFTRYQQPELDQAGHARAFFDRAGNILRRRFGESVFLITLHKPVWCGTEPWDYCLPLGGAIDCAARGGPPVGFDVAGTSLGARLLDPSVYYAHGYRSLRFEETTDGYVWTRPIEEYEDVHVIPLGELAPDDAALREVLAHDPFSDEKDLARQALTRLWDEETARRADPLEARRWKSLVGWSAGCAGR